MFVNFIFIKVLINLSATKDFPSLGVEYISMLLSFNHLTHCLDQPMFYLVFYLNCS